MSQFTKEALAGRTLVKEYDFRVMQDLSEFNTKFLWPRKENINDEEQAYIDPAEHAAEDSPFTLSEAGLSIRAYLTPPHMHESARRINKPHLKDYSDELSIEEYANSFIQPYVSGLLTTQNKFEHLFGYFEMSAKLSSAQGGWPAFWLLTFANNSWPLPEIDIMEAVHDVLDGTYHGNAHSFSTGEKVSLDGEETTFFVDKQLTEDYHRYGVSWGPGHIKWIFEGVEVMRCDTPDDMKDHPAHILLNLAVGGWGGDPKPSDYVSGEKSTFDIEYVRVYEHEQKDSEAEPPTTDDLKALRGDVVGTLSDGRVVTLADLDLANRYYLQVAEEAAAKIKAS